ECRLLRVGVNPGVGVTTGKLQPNERPLAGLVACRRLSLARRRPSVSRRVSGIYQQIELLAGHGWSSPTKDLEKHALLSCAQARGPTVSTVPAAIQDRFAGKHCCKLRQVAGTIAARGTCPSRSSRCRHART